MENSIFNDDPLYLKSLVGRTVSIKTVDERIHVGIVYVVDPVYKTLVLINKDTNKLEFVLNHAINSVNISTDNRNEEFLQSFKDTYNYEEASHQKMRLMKWLKYMFIDVREDGELLRVEDHLIIGPPYGKNECLCDNTIVLKRIRNIIDQMPSDFN